MANFIGEIRLFGGNFAPAGWVECDGRTLAIDQYIALFNLIGTTFGGDGLFTFNAPDLRGRVPIHFGNGFGVGDTGGTETETLSLAQIPSHSHAIAVSSMAGTSSPAGAYFASGEETVYALSSSGSLNSSVVSNTGSGQAHNNMMPYTAVTYIMATDGVFPGSVSDVTHMTGEVRVLAFNPGFMNTIWAACNGQLLAVSGNAILLSMVGNSYGGNAISTFGLPDLRGRVVVSTNGFSLGTRGGENTHTLTLNETNHNHTLNAAAAGTTPTAAGGVPAGGTGHNLYSLSPDNLLNTSALNRVGGGQAHNNLQPYLVVSYVIATDSNAQQAPQDPYIGEIRPLAGNTPPTGWALCDGRILALSQNTALFSIIGTMFGGDGQSNFALPDLRGRVAIGAGQGPGLSLYNIGQTGGEETHTLTPGELPTHTHTFACGGSAKGEVNTATGNYPAASNQLKAYASAPDGVTAMGPGAVQGGSAVGHNNMQPYLMMNYMISLQGIYPPRT